MTRPRARRIEIAGVAGAGKSTLSALLAERYPACRLADSLHTSVPSQWPYVAHAAPRLLPLLVRTARDRPALSWDEIKFVMYVSEWDRFLRRREYREGVIVLDQGPVFALARLLWGRKPVTRRDPFRAWVHRMIERWSRELDEVVWLDGADDTLCERIDCRDRYHDAKGRPRAEARELLAAHRQAYEQVFAVLADLGRPRVRRFDTCALSPDDLAAALADVFEGRPAGRHAAVPAAVSAS